VGQIVDTDEASGADDRLEDQLLGLWRRFLNDPSVTVDDDFFRSGGDSLLAVELLAELEKLLGARVPRSILFEAATVRQLAEHLRRPGALEEKVFVRLGGRQGRVLHFFHGDFVFGGIALKSLVEVAGPGQPIVAIAPHGLDGEPVPATIEAMAADRIAAIREAQPQGPYLLGGHCNGALVAFEAARLLTAGGERVELVLMIDPIVVSVRKGARALLTGLDGIQRLLGASEDARQSLRHWSWRKLLMLERWAHRQHLRATGNRDKILSKEARRSLVAVEKAREKELMALRERHRPLPDRAADDIAGAPPRRSTAQCYADAMATYHPEPLDVPVLYFSLKNDGGAWRRISPRTELHDLPGGHHTFGADTSPKATRRLRERLHEPGG
jgi:thioesterase domain-containing protein/acyl carrier protein